MQGIIGYDFGFFWFRDFCCGIYVYSTYSYDRNCGKIKSRARQRTQSNAPIELSFALATQLDIIHFYLRNDNVNGETVLIIRVQI